MGQMKNLAILLRDREETLRRLRSKDASPLEVSAANHIEELMEINDSLASTIIIKNEQIRRLQEMIAAAIETDRERAVR